MLICKIILRPHGDASRDREIGEVQIINVGGTTEIGEYDVRLMKSPEYAKSHGIWKRGRVSNFRRLALGPYDLLLRGLAAACGSRSPAAAHTARRETFDDESVRGI